MPLDEPLTYALVVLGVIIACVIIVYAMTRKGRRGTEIEILKDSEGLETPRVTASPFRVLRTISEEEARRAREELRILDLEREILSDAIRKLYEAHAEGKITEEERERLAKVYKERMRNVREAIEKDESLVALHELEVMQEDLIKLFSERFDEINAKINELRSKVSAKPIKEVTVPTLKTITPVEEEEEVEEKEVKAEKKRTKRPRRKKPEAAPSKLSEAEKRIEAIRAEVEKVLERLGQMELET
ncbi:hypothetical protein H5T51_02120 [Candidatus Bathyarchaeota archaeon]|nr:hypothetical protein [Candidatus Bathyarchaeota archaeon]